MRAYDPILGCTRAWDAGPGRVMIVAALGGGGGKGLGRWSRPPHSPKMAEFGPENG